MDRAITVAKLEMSMGMPIGMPMAQGRLPAPNGSTGSLIPQRLSWFTVQCVSGSAGSVCRDGSAVSVSQGAPV